MAASPKETIRIYIDNSNVYIEGQKTFSNDPKQSATWRYSVVNLRGVLTWQSSLTLDPHLKSVETKTTLYGSVPPPSDTWKWIEAQDVTVHKFDRSPLTGKEKQVDTKMVADIVRQATIDQIEKNNSEFIVVTGDADIYPAIEYVVKSGFSAHIWSWKSSLSSTYEPEWDVSGSQTVTLYHLDDYRDQFSYQQECHWGVYCKAWSHCAYYHSARACHYFAQHHAPKPLVRYYECKKGGSCDRRYTCNYYHDEVERLCPTCDETGNGHSEIGSPEWNLKHNPGTDEVWIRGKKYDTDEELIAELKKNIWY